LTADERVITGIPLWLLAAYLIDLGGVACSAEEIDGPGWRARLTPAEDFQRGSLVVGQVNLALDGDADALARLKTALEKKLLRGGG
jgi:hypothetical protein